MYCPICHKPIIGPPAVSRGDNKTEICSSCGVQEALDAFSTAVFGEPVKRE